MPQRNPIRILTIAILGLALTGCSGLLTSDPPPEPQNQPPTAAFTCAQFNDGDPVEIEGQATLTDTLVAPARFLCNSGASSDDDGQVVARTWTLNGNPITQSPAHEVELDNERLEFSLDQSGSYTLQLTVTDEDGATGSAENDHFTLSRTVPTSVEPGQTFSVEVEVTVHQKTSAVVLRDGVPEGFEVESGNVRDVSLNLASGKSHTNRYTLEAPETTGTFAIRGLVLSGSDFDPLPLTSELVVEGE